MNKNWSLAPTFSDKVRKSTVRLQAYPDDIATDLYFGIYNYAGSVITILTHLLQFGIQFDDCVSQIMYKAE